ncbi:MAG TPA: hypothetical protein VGK81_03060, partial [Anaerolineae bacterium]
MLDINDFFHLPPVDDLIDQLVTDGPGLVIVAGFDPPAALTQETILPSGKSGLLRILMQQMLSAKPHSRGIVVAPDQNSAHIPRNLLRSIDVITPRADEDKVQCIARAVLRRPELLVIDSLTPQVTTAALTAAAQGLRVLAPMDTALRGADLAQHLLRWGAPLEQLAALTWIVSVQRIPTLCPTCRRVDMLDESRINTYRTHLSEFDPQLGYYIAQGGTECNGTGHQGDVSVFDFFRAAQPAPAMFNTASLLTAGQYAYGLAAKGYLSLDDALHVATGQLGRLQQLLEASQQAYAENYHALRLKLFELETSNRVLQQRTEALISLERLGSD